MTRKLVFRVMAFSWHSGGNVGDFPQAGLEVLSELHRSQQACQTALLSTHGSPQVQVQEA
jgi:hypothetical protein